MKTNKIKVHLHITRDGSWAITNPDGSPTAICTSSTTDGLFDTLQAAKKAVRSADCVPVRDCSRDNRRWTA